MLITPSFTPNNTLYQIIYGMMIVQILVHGLLQIQVHWEFNGL